MGGYNEDIREEAMRKEEDNFLSLLIKIN